jgi:hypothetical protein
LAATNLLYHFPPLFTMLSLMSTRPELAREVLDRSLYVELFTDTETLARVAHHWLSALATTGVALMLLATRPTAASGRTAVFAARAALAATMLQLPAGVWLLFSSPAGVQSQLLGGDAAGTALFGVAVFCIVLLLQQLLTAALGDDSRRTAVKCAVLLLMVLLLMSAVLHWTRGERFGRTTESGEAGPKIVSHTSLENTASVAAGRFDRTSIGTTRARRKFLRVNYFLLTHNLDLYGTAY